MSTEPPLPDLDISDDEQFSREASNRKRSSRVPKTKSKCERPGGDDDPCKSCSATGTGPSFKRGPPKGYIHAIEQRWHQVESVLGAILSSKDPHVQALINNLRKDKLACDILGRVDSGPFGPTGRLSHSAAMTKEDFFASIMKSDVQHPRDPSRPKRESRMSREIVSSNNSMLVTPTLEWQDRLSSRYALADKPETSDPLPRLNPGGQPPAQRRRLDKGSSAPSDWSGLYTLDPVSGDEVRSGVMTLEVAQLGLPSGLHLLSQADRTDERKIGGVWQLPMARIWPHAVNRFIPEDSVKVTMPPLDVQRHLLDLYFIYVHPVFPVIHKSLFWKDFEASFSGSSARERPHVSNLLLLSMFAIAARYDQVEAPPLDPGNLWEAGLDYMVQAREVLNRVYHYCRGTTCQALLLLGLREFGIGQMEHGWLYTGMAFRMAQDLGLHRDAALWKMNGRNMFSPQELQARKQIWWGCVRADKYTAVYMGRPPTISEWHFDTPPPEDEADDYWAPHSSDPASIDFKPVPNRALASFRRVAILCVITGNVINRIYPVHSPPQSVKRAALAELGAQLDQWYTELPDYLAFDPASSRSIPPPSVLLMHASYWNTVLLLHRCFHRSTPNTIRESDSLALKSFDICQTAASHITSILTMRPSNVQTSIILQQTLTCLKDMEVIWPSAYRAWGLIGGAKVHVDSALLNSKPVQRHKRPADDAFGTEDRKGADLLPYAFNFGSSAEADVEVEASETSTVDNRLLATVLGIDFSSTGPSTTSYPPRYEWWPRDQSQPRTRTPDSSHTVTSSPRSGSNHSSPAAAMPIPFSFDQANNFWDSPLLQDVGVNFVAGV
ncbi:fungal-specific transcription factor domain-containing protein [Lactifluus subvellereus]|nr:fungal-specific transcription factor domain-containing protein [Lactifluus subvellereus]